MIGALLITITSLASLGAGMASWTRPGHLAQTVPTPTPTEEARPEPLPTATPAPPSEPSSPGGETPREEVPPLTPVSSPVLPVAIPYNDMNVRFGPGTDYPVIGMANAGRPYPILAKDVAGDWWQVEYEGNVGWLYAPLTQTQGDVSHVPVAEHPLPTIVPTPTPTETLSPPPEVALELTADPPWAIPGRQVTFHLTIRNTGVINLEGVRVRDELPPEITPREVLSPRGDVYIEGQVVLVDLGDLPAGETLSLFIKGDVLPTAPPGGVIDNIIAVSDAVSLRSSVGVSLPLPPAELPPTGSSIPCP